MENLLTIYHGSSKVVDSPTFGLGRKNNDFGLGFYCTESNDLAKEWAVSSLRDGFSSDKVIITSDNPRFEEPQDIINDMLAGLDNKQMKKVISIVDRREAIRTACMMAEKGDVILIAGKGHEDYQEIQGVKHHFDDKEVVREIFNA